MSERELVPCRFLDVGMSNGERSQFTLWPLDNYYINMATGEILIAFKQVTQETITIRGPHVVWYAESEGKGYIPEKLDLERLGYGKRKPHADVQTPDV